MAKSIDPRSALLSVGLYIFFCAIMLMLSGALLVGLGGYLFGATCGVMAAAVVANILAMRIFESRGFFDIGLEWTLASGRNLLLGLAGGAGTAVLVLGPPLAVGAARLEASPEPAVTWAGMLWITLLSLLGSVGEEVLFRGYGFQVLIRTFGQFTAVLPAGVAFAALHGDNPHSTGLGLANTVGFGILFGYAFLRSHDLWLPIGLHFGWNIALLAFGVNLSGLTIRLSRYSVHWNAGQLWSGGDYGPEGSVLTSVALAAMALYLWRAPVRRQAAPLLQDPAREA